MLHKLESHLSSGSPITHSTTDSRQFSTIPAPGCYNQSNGALDLGRLMTKNEDRRVTTLPSKISKAVLGLGKLFTISCEGGEWSGVKVHRATIKAIIKTQLKYYHRGVNLRIVSIVGPRSESSGKSTLLNLLWSNGAKMSDDVLQYARDLDKGTSPSTAIPIRPVREANVYQDALLQNQCTHCLGHCDDGLNTLSVDAWIAPCPIDAEREMCLVLDIPGYNPSCWYREKAMAGDSHAIAALEDSESSSFRLVCDCGCKKNTCIAHQKMLQVVTGLSSVLMINLPSDRTMSNPDGLPSIEGFEETMRPLVASMLATSDHSSNHVTKLPYVQFMIRDNWAKSSRPWTQNLEASENPVIKLVLSLFDRFSVTILPPLPELFLKTLSLISSWPKSQKQLQQLQTSRQRSFTEEGYDLKFAIQTQIRANHEMGKWNALPTKFWESLPGQVKGRMAFPCDMLEPILQRCGDVMMSTTENTLSSYYFVTFIVPKSTTERVTGCTETCLSISTQSIVTNLILEELDRTVENGQATFRSMIMRRLQRFVMYEGVRDAGEIDQEWQLVSSLGWDTGHLNSNMKDILMVADNDLLLIGDMCKIEVVQKTQENVALMVSKILSSKDGIDLLEILTTDLRKCIDQDFSRILTVSSELKQVMSGELSKSAMVSFNRLNRTIPRGGSNRQLQVLVREYLRYSVGVQNVQNMSRLQDESEGDKAKNIEHKIAMSVNVEPRNSQRIWGS